MLMLVYVSSATRLLSHAELLKLLHTSRSNNQRDQITGVLLYDDGNFLQAVEGPDAAIRALYARLEQDERHHNLRVVIEEPTEERQFAQWSMGFVPQKAIPAKDLAAFSSFLSDPADARVPAKIDGAVRVALDVFRHHVR
jgi:hypothetical protein